jgi:Uma2 family endonuclease
MPGPLSVVEGRPSTAIRPLPPLCQDTCRTAESSLRFDSIEKGSLYARAGIVDYWIVNLIDRVVEVYRESGTGLTAPYGWRYMSVERFAPPSAIMPIAVPATPIPVAALIP